MMEPVHRVDGTGADACQGHVRLDITKSLWNGTMMIGTLAAPFFMTPGALIFCLISLYVTLLLGHSVGMHRIMIHRSADAKPWLERTLILLGTWVGIGGPTQIVAIHDIRDWAQRQPACHDFFSHRRSYWRDISWQLFYRFEFEQPPTVILEPDLSDDPTYRHLSRYWRIHQIILAGLLFLIGGLPWVLWGVCVRVLVSTLGHWSVTYRCHNPGPGQYTVPSAGVQASDLVYPLSGFLTHGECWHSNHHAFPESARIGLQAGQIDPAAWVLERLSDLGWVTRLGQPRPEDKRSDLAVRQSLHAD